MRKHRTAVLTGAGLAGALAVAFLVYRWLWPDVPTFVRKIDHCQLLFCDFARHYYTTGQRVLTTGLPDPQFFYTAFFGIVLAAWAAVPLASSVVYWGALQVLAAGALAVLPLRVCARRAWWCPGAYVLVLLTSLPVLHNFKWGQVSTLIAATVLGAFVLAHRGHSARAGLLLALGASIKYYPVLFLSYFVCRRDLRFFVSFALGCLAFVVVIPVLALGVDGALLFHEVTAKSLAASARWIAIDPNSQYGPHVLARHSMTAARYVNELGLLAIGVVAANLALVWRLARRPDRRLAFAACAILFLSLPFVLQTSWPHYFVFLPLCQLTLLELTWSDVENRAVRALLAAVALASIALSSVLLFSNWAGYVRAGTLFFADILLLAGFYVWAGCSSSLARVTGPDSVDGPATSTEHR